MLVSKIVTWLSLAFLNRSISTLSGVCVSPFAQDVHPTQVGPVVGIEILTAIEIAVDQAKVKESRNSGIDRKGIQPCT